MTLDHPLAKYLHGLGYDLRGRSPSELRYILLTAFAVGQKTLTRVAQLDELHPNDPEVPLRHLKGESDPVHACYGWLVQTNWTYRHLCQLPDPQMRKPDPPLILACICWWDIRTHGWDLHRTVYRDSPLIDPLPN